VLMSVPKSWAITLTGVFVCNNTSIWFLCSGVNYLWF
jgi:hypothetical protein